MPKSKTKSPGRGKGKSKSKMAANSTPPKYTARPPTRGTPGGNRRLARSEAGENGGATRGRALSQPRRGGNRRGKP
jgi:hypothetical protein